MGMQDNGPDTPAAPVRSWTNVFETVAAVFQSKEAACAVATACNHAYEDGAGQPRSAPFTEADAEKVAVNLAGMYAADATAHAMSYAAGFSADEYVRALKRLATDDVTKSEGGLADLFANATWRAGQPFRGGNLARIGRSMNVPFASLPKDERAKDRAQVRAGAKFLLDAIEKAQ